MVMNCFDACLFCVCLVDVFPCFSRQVQSTTFCIILSLHCTVAHPYISLHSSSIITGIHPVVFIPTPRISRLRCFQATLAISSNMILHV